MIGGYQITDIAIFFIVYLVLGWVTEVIYQAVSKGLVVNRGFSQRPGVPDLRVWSAIRNSSCKCT